MSNLFLSTTNMKTHNRELKVYLDLTEVLHLKTGNVYTYLGSAAVCTNGQEGKFMAVYYADGELYVRDLAEFLLKFEDIPT